MLSSVGIATFRYSSEDLVTSYSGGENVRGNVVLSFSGENANSLITSTYPGSISIIDLVRANGYSNGDYTCDTLSCGKNYKTAGDITQLNVNSGNNKIGIYFEGREVNVRSVDFTIESDVASSCSKQLSINIGDDNSTSIQNTLYNKNGVCGSENSAGCFDKNLASSSYSNLLITGDGLCERVSLREAPAYEFSAVVQNTTNGVEGDLKMELFDNETGFIGECNLPKLEMDMQERKCIIEKPIAIGGDYYACVSLKGGNAKYQIRAESSGQVCGTGNILGEKQGDFDYEISARPMPYDVIKNLSIKDAYFKTTGVELGDYLDNYISNNYGRNCSSGCIVPVSFNGANQNLNFNNISIEYDASPGNIVTKNILKQISESDSKISSGNLTLELSYANFKIPLKTSNNLSSFNLFIDGRQVFSSSLQIDITPGFDFSVNPKFALIGVPTNFFVATSENITSGSWNFGDNVQKDTTGKIVEHTYKSEGNYTIQVSLTNTKGFTARKSVNVLVGNASQSAGVLLNLSRTKLNKINSYTSLQASWIQNYINSKLNITADNLILNALQTRLNNAQNDSEYVSIVLDIINLNLPDGIKTAKIGTVPFSLGFSGIDVSYIENISDYFVAGDKKDLLKDNIIYLNGQNYNSEVSYEEAGLVSGINDEPLYTKIKVKINNKNVNKSKSYLIIDYPIGQITFLQDYGAKSISGDYKSGTEIPLVESTQIEFIVPGKVNFADLAMYVSPVISEVGDYGESVSIAKKYPTAWVTFLLIVLLIFVFVVYILLQEWYKRHYESYLFQNRDDLYNLINFIYNSRNNKLADDAIKKKLSVNKWSGEQVSYAFKKLDGKRTGMFEIPIFRGREQAKIREEIAKRQPGFRDGKIY